MLDFHRLELFLRPPGKGVYAVSSGKGMADKLLHRIYRTKDEHKINATWLKSLHKIAHAKAILLGCPSDNGAGIIRGANMGPLGLREHLYKNSTFQKWIHTGTVLDIGDIFVIPQLLEDEMLSDSQKEKNRNELYPKESPPLLPVSPLSILKEVSSCVLSANPHIKIMTLGGDHSISWPLMLSLYDHIQNPFAILHIDAHTDLLRSRLGISHCFGTWAYHANDLIGRHQRLVQVGIRASGKPKNYWETTLDVKQFWSDEIRKKETWLLQKIISHLESLKIRKIYISNDIDGTGMEYVASTATPEPKGLHPRFVLTLIEEVGKKFDVIGADLVEVAPVLGLNHRGEPHRTLKIGCNYIIESIQALLARL